MSSTPQPPSQQFRIALCQMPVTSDKQQNLSVARDYLRRAHEAHAEVAVLPECFQSPYDTKCFREYAEKLPSLPLQSGQAHSSPSLRMLQEAAKETGMYIIGGSVPEIDVEGKVFNTSMSISPKGDLIAKHRKAHLFDIDVPGGICFKESDVLSPGNSATAFDAPSLGCKIGVSICYDVRFPELAMVQSRDLGATLLVLPGAFNMTTGPAHWELLLRSRALDNQVFVAACSPARDENGGYVAWGHSMVVDPWGKVLESAEEGESLVVCEIDLTRVKEVRGAVPTGMQRRVDMYRTSYLKG